MSFDCISRTHVGLRRKVNEDAVFVRTERGLWAVADGMGGHEAGDVASAKVAEALQHLPIVYGLDELVEAAIDALYGVNRELIELGRSEGRSRTIGTTVVGLAVPGGLPLLLGRRQSCISCAQRADSSPLARSQPGAG